MGHLAYMRGIKTVYIFFPREIQSEERDFLEVVSVDQNLMFSWS
jgi:hypothetical protein